MKKYIVAGLLLLVLLSNPALAIHTHGKGGYASVETDGFDDGYYLVVWSNSSGVFGALYKVADNTRVKNITIYDKAAGMTAIASTKIDNSQASDNVYLVAWLDSNGYPYARLLDYQGNPLTDPISINVSNVAGDYIGAGYGNGYFVVAYEGGSGHYQELYYAIIDRTGNLGVTDKGLLHSFPGAIHYTRKVAYDPTTGYFGIFLRNKDSSGNYDASFLDFKLNDDGTLDTTTIHVLQILDNTKIYGASITHNNGGFVIAYETSYKWYTNNITILLSNGTPITDSSHDGPFYKGYRAYGGGWLEYVANGTHPYIIFAYENKENSSANFGVVIKKLDINGEVPEGSTTWDYVIAESGKDYRYPAVAAKPAHSPEAYIIVWSDTTDGTAMGSEYKPDFSEVSDTNQVPLFGNLLLVGLALGGALYLFGRR
jgi:hypothetical protein